MDAIDADERAGESDDLFRVDGVGGVGGAARESLKPGLGHGD